MLNNVLNENLYYIPCAIFVGGCIFLIVFSILGLLNKTKMSKSTSIILLIVTILYITAVAVITTIIGGGMLFIGYYAIFPAAFIFWFTWSIAELLKKKPYKKKIAAIVVLSNCLGILTIVGLIFLFFILAENGNLVINMM